MLVPRQCLIIFLYIQLKSSYNIQRNCSTSTQRIKYRKTKKIFYAAKKEVFFEISFTHNVSPSDVRKQKNNVMYTQRTTTHIKVKPISLTDLFKNLRMTSMRERIARGETRGNENLFSFFFLTFSHYKICFLF